MNSMKRILTVIFCCLLPFLSQGQDKDCCAPEHYIHHRTPLANAFSRFTQEKKGCVAFLGGSITEMEGWRNMVQEELRNRFPDTDFQFIDAGISSLGSTPHAFRFESDVLAQGTPDLLFVEAAVNDNTNEFGPEEQVKGMEGIVLHARQVNPCMDMVMLHFITEPFVEPMKKGISPDVVMNHERVANYYGISSIDLIHEIVDRMERGELTWEDFGGTHPKPLGHRYYTEAIKALFDMDASLTSKDITPHEMPATPLDENSYSRGRLLDIQEARKTKGFRIEEDWMPSDGANTRAQYIHIPTLVCEDGGSLVLEFEGTAVGIYCTCGPNAGVLSYTIDGKKYPPLNTYTRWSRTLHIPWLYILGDNLDDGHHVLKLKVLKGDRSGCYIRNFVAN